jgi:hypothetical protein
MLGLSRRVAASVALAVLAGCADVPDGRSSASVTVRASPVIVTIGGFNSCAVGSEGPTPMNTERWDRASALTARFARGDARWVRGCFDRQSRLYFISSSAPSVVTRATLADPYPFFSAVAALTDGPTHPVYVHGHSYGGWLGMFLAWELPASADVRVLSVADPISPAHCTVSSYLLAVASPLTAGIALAGCQRAPTDFLPVHRARLRARIAEGGWRHYYQRNFWPLRSGPYTDDAQPHRSYDVSPFLNGHGAHPSWNAHAGIAELSLIWYSFESSIANDYGE